MTEQLRTWPRGYNAAAVHVPYLRTDYMEPNDTGRDTLARIARAHHLAAVAAPNPTYQIAEVTGWPVVIERAAGFGQLHAGQFVEPAVREPGRVYNLQVSPDGPITGYVYGAGVTLRVEYDPVYDWFGAVEPLLFACIERGQVTDLYSTESDARGAVVRRAADIAINRSGRTGVNSSQRARNARGFLYRLRAADSLGRAYPLAVHYVRILYGETGQDPSAYPAVHYQPISMRWPDLQRAYYMETAARVDLYLAEVDAARPLFTVETETLA